MQKFETSLELLQFMKSALVSANYKNNHELRKLVTKLEELLKYDQEGHLKMLYEHACMQNNDIKLKIKYLSGEFNYLYFNNLTFSFNIDFYKQLTFKHCTFKNVTINEELKEFFKNDDLSFFDHSNNFKKIIFSNNELSVTDIKTDRLGDTRFTCHVNLYVELDRICNASCSFCRNHYYERTAYDFKKIRRVLKDIDDLADDIVIGGGEPTLKYNELTKIAKKNRDRNLIISSNLSANPKKIIKLHDIYNYRFLASRHAVDMEENAHIFGFNQEQMKNSEQNIRVLTYRGRNTLSTVCFSGGLDSYNKLLNYIHWGLERGFRSILIQTLHQDNTVGVNQFDLNNQKIDTSFIKAVKERLIDKNYFIESPTIYSQAGYKSSVIKRGPTSIAFKEYLTKEEFEIENAQAIKRTIDLSLAPDGILYENWHQNSGELLIKKKSLFNFKK